MSNVVSTNARGGLGVVVVHVLGISFASGRVLISVPSELDFIGAH